jgi:hypothetical protein
MKNPTEIVFDMACDQVRELVMDSFCKEHPDCTMKDIAALGVTMDEAVCQARDYLSVMDAAPNAQTTATNITPVQFAQFWLTNPIKILTRGRSLDKVIGRTVVGTWETEQIVATILERMGQPGIYGDFTKAPLADWNVNFETRDNIRFEMGVEVGKLEEARASQMRLNSYAMKRDAMAEAFAILLNNVGWYGFRSDSENFVGSSKKIYGLLNDPNVTADTIGRTTWEGSAVTMDTICGDIQQIVTDAVKNLKGNYDPESDAATLALPNTQYVQLGKINTYGISARDWLAKTYPRIRVISCAELVGAVSNSDVALFIVDKVMGDSTVQQMLTSSLRLVGVQPMAKGSYEVYSCSTAGALVRYPLAYGMYKFSA